MTFNAVCKNEESAVSITVDTEITTITDWKDLMSPTSSFADGLLSPPTKSAEFPGLDQVQEDPHDYLEDTDMLHYVKILPPPCADHEIPDVLPKKTHPAKMTLALDMDETMVHAKLDKVHRGWSPIDPGSKFEPWEHDHSFLLDVPQYQPYNIRVRHRPHLATFLERVSELFEVVVFTAAPKCYAEPILDRLDPHRTLFAHRLYEDSCRKVGHRYIKDLRVMGRDLSSLLLVDNTPYVFSYQLDNGVPIKSFRGQNHDRELVKLLDFLELVAYHSPADVRPYLRKRHALRRKLQLYED